MSKSSRQKQNTESKRMPAFLQGVILHLALSSISILFAREVFSTFKDAFAMCGIGFQFVYVVPLILLLLADASNLKRGARTIMGILSSTLLFFIFAIFTLLSSGLNFTISA